MAAVETDRMFTVPAIRLADALVGPQPRRVALPLRLAHTGSRRGVTVPTTSSRCRSPSTSSTTRRRPASSAPTRPQALATATHGAWVAFAKNGDPNNAALPDWPRYDSAHPPDDAASTSRAAWRTDPAADEMALWDGVL